MGQNFFPWILMKISVKPNFDMEHSKSELIFSILFIFILIFALISQKSFQNESKKFFSNFHENFYIPYFFEMPGAFI